ncbi:MAG: serine hydrolase domain-containing protein [Polyangiaceae bacterium]
MKAVVGLGFAALVVGSALAAACSDAPDSGTSRPELDDATIAELGALADNAIAAGIPGVTLAIQAGDQTVTIARGVADSATGATMTPAHHVRMGSVAKSFLASIVLQLEDERKLSLSDTIESRLPGMVTGNKDATIEQVLRLQSGSFDHASDARYLTPYLEGHFDYAYTPQALIALSNDHPPVFAPGAQFNYSNTNYVIIGLIIEKITGKSLADVVAERITRPLGMNETTMPLGSEMEAPAAHGYLVGMGDPIDVTGISASSAYGHGNAVSTPADMNRFYGALVAGKVVNPSRLPDMFTPDARIDTQYGIGVWAKDNFPPCSNWIGHDGASPGFDNASYARRDGKRQVTVSITQLTPDDKAGDEKAQKAWGDLVIAAGCK